VGATGICDCLTLGDAEYGTLSVTTAFNVPPGSTINLQGTLDCAGGSFSSSCQPLVCPDFSTCDLEANSLLLENSGTGQLVRLLKTGVLVESPSPFASAVILGDSSIATSRLATLIAYATSVTLDGLSSLLLRTINGPMTIQAGAGSALNHLNLISQAAQIIASAAQGISFTTSAGTIQFTAGTASHSMSTAGQWIGVGTEMTMSSNHITLENAAATNSSIETNSNNSYQCPVVGTALTTLLGPSSIFVGNDLALASGTRFHSLNPSGRFESVGLSFYCNAQIDTVDGSPLILQNNASTLVDMRGSIVNTITTTPVTVSDPEGLSIDDGGVPSISNLFTNHISPVGAGTDIVIHGNLLVDGNFSYTGLDGAAGGDLTGTYPDPTLVVIGSPAGPFGGAMEAPIVTIDGKGRVTALSSTPITGTSPGGSAGGDLAGTYPNPTLAAIGSATGPVGSLNVIPVATIDTKGRVTALTSQSTVGLLFANSASFTASGTWNSPAGCTQALLVGCGGGGGGAGGTGGTASALSIIGRGGAGGGAGGAAFVTEQSISVTPSSAYTVTIGNAGTAGAGGAGGIVGVVGPTTGTAGGNGGFTSIGFGGTTYYFAGAVGGSVGVAPVWNSADGTGGASGRSSYGSAEVSGGNTATSTTGIMFSTVPAGTGTKGTTNSGTGGGSGAPGVGSFATTSLLNGGAGGNGGAVSAVGGAAGAGTATSGYGAGGAGGGGGGGAGSDAAGFNGGAGGAGRVGGGGVLFIFY
jgi:hypothetical protein